MVILERVSRDPYRCTTGTADLAAAANGEKLFPTQWISPDGFFVTEDFLRFKGHRVAPGR